MINKANDGVFTANDEAVFEKYLQFCGIGLRNAQLYERSQLEVKGPLWKSAPGLAENIEHPIRLL